MLLTPRALPLHHVLLGAAVHDEEGLFQAVAAVVASGDRVRQSQIARRLGLRHQRGSAAIGCGLALPHAAVPALGRATAVYVRPAAPLPLCGPDGQAVTDVLALLVPLPGFESDNEWFWSVLSRLRSGPLAARLRALTDPASVHRLLTQGVEQ